MKLLKIWLLLCVCLTPLAAEAKKKNKTPPQQQEAPAAQPVPDAEPTPEPGLSVAETGEEEPAPNAEAPDCSKKKKDKLLKEICESLEATRKEQDSINKVIREDESGPVTAEVIAPEDGKEDKKKKDEESEISAGDKKSGKQARLLQEGEEPMVRVRMGRKTLTIPMEEYLAGVIGNEMSASWPLEALKAQAVAARSYALYGMLKAQKKGNHSYALLPTQADQVFRVRESKNPYLLKITESTRGEVLTKKGRVVQAFYSSTCGGKTRSAVDAGLSKDSPLTKGCTDRYCEISPFRGWYVSMSLEDVEKKLNQAGYKVKGVKSVKVKTRDKAGYALTVMVRDEGEYHYIPAWKFRSAIGYMRIKSVLFSVISEENSIHIHGNGFGHGVGLCQFGAKSMAQHNKNYKQILNKFYPKTTLVKWY